MLKFLATLAACLAMAGPAPAETLSFVDPVQILTRTVSQDASSTVTTLEPGLVVSRPNAFRPPMVTRDCVALFTLASLEGAHHADLLIDAQFLGRQVVYLSASSAPGLVLAVGDFPRGTSLPASLLPFALDPFGPTSRFTRDLTEALLLARATGDTHLKVFLWSGTGSEWSSAAQFTVRIGVAPEPPAWILAVLGLPALAFVLRRRP